MAQLLHGERRQYGGRPVSCRPPPATRIRHTPVQGVSLPLERPGGGHSRPGSAAQRTRQVALDRHGRSACDQFDRVRRHRLRGDGLPPQGGGAPIGHGWNPRACAQADHARTFDRGGAGLSLWPDDRSRGCVCGVEILGMASRPEPSGRRLPASSARRISASIALCRAGS